MFARHECAQQFLARQRKPLDEAEVVTMIVIGLILILLAVGAAAFAAVAPGTTTQTIELTAVGVTVQATPLALFVSGAASVLLLVAGFALVSRGAKRRAKTRRELKALRKEQAASNTGAQRANAGGSTIATATAPQGRQAPGTLERPEGATGSSTQSYGLRDEPKPSSGTEPPAPR